MLTAEQVLHELQTLGTEQNRKKYRRHGAGGDVYGVSFADLSKLKKRIKTDHALAQALWAAGVYEARLLAAMIADSSRADEQLVDSWVQDLNDYVTTDMFTSFVSGTRFTRLKITQWTASDEQWIGRAGWQLLAQLAMADTALPNAYFEPFLAIIEREIHTRKNRVRDAMNSALIAIGIRNQELEERALAVATTIGKIIVDHGETNCKTPDAAAYIRKTRQRTAIP